MFTRRNHLFWRSQRTLVREKTSIIKERGMVLLGFVSLTQRSRWKTADPSRRASWGTGRTGLGSVLTFDTKQLVPAHRFVQRGRNITGENQQDGKSRRGLNDAGE